MKSPKQWVTPSQYTVSIHSVHLLGVGCSNITQHVVATYCLSLYDYALCSSPQPMLLVVYTDLADGLFHFYVRNCVVM